MAGIRRSLKDKVYNALKEQILNRDFIPGDRLNIDSIAREMGVSNSPVREAINLLITDGLVENIQNSSPRVTCVSQEEKHDLYCAISALLVGAYTIHIAGKREDELLAVMEERFAFQKKMMEVGSSDMQIKAAMEFDQSIVDVSGNTRLKTIYDALVIMFFLTLHTYALGHNRELSMVEHQGIIDAVRARDLTLLQTRLKAHYYQVIKPEEPRTSKFKSQL